ncbi:MAG: hypothetical protein ACJ77A_08175 [Actinomycetota bacterium]
MSSKRPALFVSFALALALVLFAPSAAWAAPGDLDTTFGGGDGVVTIHGSVEAGRILRQPLGWFVVAGSLNGNVFLARYRGDGSRYKVFGGGDGVATLDFQGGLDSVSGLNRMPDGRLVVSGTSEDSGGVNRRISAARFTPVGVPDSTFSGDGKTTTAFPGYGESVGLGSALQPDGKLVVAGFALNSTDSDLVVVRYRANGTLDSSFSGDGRFTIDLGGDDHAWVVRLLSDGTILAAGESIGSNAASGARMALVWLTPSGNLSHAYGGGDGKAIVDLFPNNAEETAHAVFVLGSGKIVVVGDANRGGGGQDVVEVRLTPSGAKDHTFGGGDGVVVSDGGGGDDFVSGAVRLSDGTVVVALASKGLAASSPYEFAVARLRPNGTADPTFGTGGFARPFAGQDGRANDTFVRPNGRIMVTGRVNATITTVRLLP